MPRGDIVRLSPPKNEGREQQGSRFGVVIQSDALAPLSTVLVAPTSQSALYTHFRPVINIGSEQTKVLVEQLTAIDVRRASETVGHVSTEELWSIDDVVALVVGLH
ncbi:MAG TPA: type II toxin-antitoxin system PemK/MazF family toxin [Acidimicrobiales bacterium]|nr:type II toxin-antitoxin system PemK/MazF family toxin [Acidimicrobiales bacterium]